MQVKMAAASSICVGFLVLVLCLSHGSWLGSARLVISDDFITSQSKMQLGEESNQDANEPISPNSLSGTEAVDENNNNNQPLEVVHDSASPTLISGIDQSDCGRPFGRVVIPGSRIPWGQAPSYSPIQPYPYSPQPGYQPNPACQPACAPSSWYPPQPQPQPQPNPACQPACAPSSWYPPQPTPECQPACQPACAPSSWYPPQPTPECQPACQPACAPAHSWYPPQTNPGCEPSSSPYPNPECQPAYAPSPAPYSPQPNPGCQPAQTNPGCQPAQTNPGCVNPGCQPTNYPPQTNPGCVTPECQPAYPPQMEPSNPPLPASFYPPQHEPYDPFGPRLDEQTSLEQENSGSPQSSEGEIIAADKVEEGLPLTEQN